MMTASARPPTSLAWRLALVALLLHLAYLAAIHGYTLFFMPQTDAMRELFGSPRYLAQLAAYTASTLAISGLVAWITMHRWLARHAARAVDEPRKLYCTFIPLLLLFLLISSSALAIVHSRLTDLLLTYGQVLDDWFGPNIAWKFMALTLVNKAMAVILDILGVWAVVRIAAWTVQPAGAAGAPAYARLHASWIAGLTVLIWQLSASAMLGGYLQAQLSNPGWLEYVLGALVLPAAVLPLCALACLKALPDELGRAGPRRAVAHGTLAFWIAQVLGAGLAYLIVRAMTWHQLMRAAQSYMTGGVALLAYGALLALACVLGKRALYRQGRGQASQA